MHPFRMNLASSKEKDCLRLNTRGNNMLFFKGIGINHRKSSSLASSPTKRRRSRFTRKYREMCGGTSVDDMKAQMTFDFKRQSHEIKAHIK